MVFGGNLSICVAETKINDFDVVIGVQKHVLRLQVSMYDAQTMKIVDPIDDLMKESAGLSLS